MENYILKNVFFLVKHAAVVSGQRAACAGCIMVRGGGSWGLLIRWSKHLSLFIHLADHISPYEKHHYLAAKSCWKAKWEFDDNNITYCWLCHGSCFHIYCLCKLLEIWLFCKNLNHPSLRMNWDIQEPPWLMWTLYYNTGVTSSFRIKLHVKYSDPVLS